MAKRNDNPRAPHQSDRHRRRTVPNARPSRRAAADRSAEASQPIGRAGRAIEAAALEPMRPMTEHRASKPRDRTPKQRRTKPPEQLAALALPAYAPLAAAHRARRRARRDRRRRRDLELAARHRPTPADIAAADATRALQDSVAQLSSELATLKAGIASAQRSTGAQFGKLTERLDRTEKAQAEPAAKLAKIQESIDRLEQRAAAGRRVRRRAAPDITGSVASPKEAVEAAGRRRLAAARLLRRPRRGREPQRHAVRGRPGIERAGPRQGREPSSARTARSWW